MAKNIDRLISFVGLGSKNESGQNDYKPTRYFWEGRGEGPIQTKHVSLALTRILQPAETVLLTTAKARETWQERLPAAFQEVGLPAPKFVDIPDGKDQSELWRIFEICRTHLDPPEAMSGGTVMDITHGFRSQPFLAGAAAAFTRLTRNLDDSRSVTLVYGAFEARDAEDRTPIIDLTSFLDIVDWAQAIMLFLRTGRGKDLVALTSRDAGALFRRWDEGGRPGTKPGLTGLKRPLEDFAADLATLRTGSLLLPTGTAQKLKAKIDELDTELKGHPALTTIIDRLRTMAADLVLPDGVDTLSGPDAQKTMAALARRYLEMDRYMEAAAIVREGMVSLYAQPEAGRPGQSFSKKARDEAECRWRRLDSNARGDGQLRNDLLHAGFNRGPAGAPQIANGVRKLVENLATAQIPEETQSSPLFLNLSNHPSAEWEATQREAARKLAPEIRDLPFPAVPPEADDAAISQIARDLAKQVPPGTTHAMIQGEFTLAFALVRELYRDGVVCLAATTDREMETEPDGSRRYRFRFVRFRAYPV
ncbi:TM1812 family CRISPR-associated protein [Rhodospirillum centenum]|uniref:CRISPR-associated protein, putative n=1 Tax=Rhodospirillum centenum (strain ATCC 51521 / SW) TaxID=414684 RepID=B6IX21_RHOCS|nr:TM1812 family CRISPR-associated protein [Rhodospirillum centenum]ACJ00845.1 CRISPR-associated protein, putative [Rhodospirillum centenum SW]